MVVTPDTLAALKQLRGDTETLEPTMILVFRAFEVADKPASGQYGESRGSGRGELVSNLVEIPSRRFSSSGGDCLLRAHRQLG